MTTETAKKMFDAFYLGKRIFEQQPELPKGVTSSFIHVLDTIVRLRQSGDVRISDISNVLDLTRPGITRTVKQMEQLGYLAKISDPVDGRVVHLRLTDQGEQLYARYVKEYFSGVTHRLADISDEDVDTMYQIILRISQHYTK